MRKWVGRRGGGSVSFIFATGTLIYGAPGHIDDAEQWSEWLRGMGTMSLDWSILQPIALVGMVASFGVATSEWWWHRLFPKRQDATIVSASEAAGVEQFVELLPLIERQRDAYRPMRLPPPPDWASPVTMVNRSADHHELLAELSVLGVPHPPNGASRQAWFLYLTHLEALAEDGDLAGARAMAP